MPLTDARPKLTRVFVLYRTDGAFVNALHVYDGPSKVQAFDDIALEGDHTGDSDSNTWVIDPPLEIHFGLGMSVLITNNAYKNIEAQGEEDTAPDEVGFAAKAKVMVRPASVLFTAAGAEFEVPGSDIQSGPGTNTLLPGERLHPGQRLISSNGTYELHWQFDGNLVLASTSDGSPKFSTGTLSPPGFLGSGYAYCEMQGDGNFVVHHHPGGAWDSETWGHPGAFLRVRDDGHVVIIDPVNPIWRRPD